jgi:NADH:ubiquinone oxidoreductase subunit F (NADH-binding)
MRYDPADTRRAGVRLGAGVVHVLARETCGVAETARILGYLAAESARQCGPCEYGLAALAAVVDRLARGAGRPDDLRHLRRWVRQLAPDRGACRHPDGAVGLLRSALDAFGPDFEWHASRGACSYAYRPRQIRVPPPRDAWR